MSRFVYSGSTRQVYTLSAGDKRLRAFYGKWQLMALEGLLLLLSAAALVYFYFSVPLSDDDFLELFAFVTAGLCLFFAAVYGSAYWILKKKGRGGRLKNRALFDGVAGVLILLLPRAFIPFISSLTAFALSIAGALLFFAARRTGKRIIGLVLLLCAAFTAFMPKTLFPYFVIMLAVIEVGAGVYTLWRCASFARALKHVEDEQAGFTDYSIE